MRRIDDFDAIAADGGSHTESAVAQAARLNANTAPKAVYIRESTVEDYFVAGVEALGGMCEKFVSPGRKGVPDRLITWPAPLSLMDLAELKAPKGPVKAHQRRDHKRRARLGIKVHCLYTKADVDNYLATVRLILEVKC